VLSSQMGLVEFRRAKRADFLVWALLIDELELRKRGGFTFVLEEVLAIGFMLV